jgi:hypothetical protein
MEIVNQRTGKKMILCGDNGGQHIYMHKKGDEDIRDSMDDLVLYFKEMFQVDQLTKCEKISRFKNMVNNF